MKRYIRAADIPDDVVNHARDLLESRADKGSTIDIPNHRMEIVWFKGATESGLMEEGMMGDWLKQHGFDLSFEIKDVEYTTKGTFNPRSMSKYRGHTAYLRNRLVMTVTW